MKQETRELTCELTENELLARGDTLSNTLKNIETWRNQKAFLTTQIKHAEEQVESLSSAILYKQEVREVPVHKALFGGLINVFRDDTGALIYTRQPTADELQLEFKFDAENDALNAEILEGESDHA